MVNTGTEIVPIGCETVCVCVCVQVRLQVSWTIAQASVASSFRLVPPGLLVGGGGGGGGSGSSTSSELCSICNSFCSEPVG